MKTICPACHAAFKVKNENVGRRGKCPKCREPFIVTDSSTPHIKATIADEPQESKSSASVIVIVALAVAAIAGAAGYVGGTLTTRPLRSELDGKVAAAVEDVREGLTAENETLKAEVQKLRQSHGVDIDKLVTAIEIRRLSSCLDIILSLQRRAVEVHPIGSKAHLAVMQCTQKETEFFSIIVGKIPAPEKGRLKNAHKTLELKVAGAWQFQQSLTDMCNYPNNKDYSEKLRQVTDEMHEVNALANTAELLLLDECVKGLGARGFGEMGKVPPKSGI